VTWTFDLSDRPFDRAERDALAADLHGLGSDPSLLEVWSATVSTASRLTRPQVLRAHDGRDLAGAAVVLVCRDYGASFFASPALTRALRAGPPIWYWERTGLGTDGHSGPAVVAAGVRREDLVAAAVRWLGRRFLVGTVVEHPDEPVRPGQLEWPGTGVSTMAAAAGAQPLLREHRNLARKVRRFANRGGRVERLDGPLPPALLARLVETYGVRRPINPPFVELYPEMVAAHCSVASDRLVHLVAHLDGGPVGYHSWWRSGTRLSLLSGAFLRPPGGTAHAYENVLLESVEAARQVGADLLDLGPTVNAVKVSLADQTPTVLRFVSRHAPVRAALAAALPRSRLSTRHVADALGRPAT
jgi:hypothetical protein